MKTITKGDYELQIFPYDVWYYEVLCHNIKTGNFEGKILTNDIDYAIKHFTETTYYMDYAHGKYEIVRHTPGCKFNSYLRSITKTGEYIFCTDYLYSKKMTEKTAKKHLEILNAKEI